MSFSHDSTVINNAVYDDLGERWYSAQDDPIALLRAEAELRNPWLIEKLGPFGPPAACRVLDVGCGGGFLTNALAKQGYDVTGVDLSASSLKTAARFDATTSVTYQQADATSLPFSDETFHAVSAMDFLEHVDDPARVIAEAARVLRPGGRFFFSTFNRTLLSRLLIINAVEHFVLNVPANMHLHSMFIRPEELRNMCEASGLVQNEVRGMRPVLLSRASLKLLRTGVVPTDFRFAFTPSLAGAYLGYATRSAQPRSAT